MGKGYLADSLPGPLPRERENTVSVALEVLDVAFVLLGGLERLEGAQVAALARLRVELAGVEAVFAGLQFADHDSLVPRGTVLVPTVVTLADPEEKPMI